VARGAFFLAFSVTLGALAAAPMACGLGITGSADDGGAEDASLVYEVPDETDAGLDLDASTDADADAEAGPTCHPVGDPCARQSDCCPQSFCGRRQSSYSYACLQCLASTSYCNSNAQCCSGSCVQVSQYSRRCK
jgi:hypothetical protein